MFWQLLIYLNLNYINIFVYNKEKFISYKKYLICEFKLYFILKVLLQILHLTWYIIYIFF